MFFFCFSYRRISISINIDGPEPPPPYGGGVQRPPIASDTMEPVQRAPVDQYMGGKEKKRKLFKG
jgi:hypothetical protein